MSTDYGIKRGEGNVDPIVITKDNAISRGRFISNLEFRKSDKGQWFSIDVRDKEGKGARKSYFPPVLGSQYIQTQEVYQKELRKFNSMMRNLTDVLLSKKYETGPVSSFEEFCNKVISDIGKSYVGKELRIKLVYDSKNKPTLPAWPLMFEDPIQVSDLESKMKLTEWDKTTPAEIAMDSEPGFGLGPQAAKAAEEIVVPPKKSEDDLPF
jgi:hypothetical protein